MSAPEPPLLEAPPADELRCPACLSLVRPGQRFCLECGQRLAEPGLPPPDGARGARLSPGRRLALAVAAIVLVAGGVAIAWAVASDDDDGDRTLVLSAPPHSIPLPTASVPASGELPATTGPEGTLPTVPTSPTEPTDIPTFTDTTDTGASIEEPTTTDEPATAESEPPVDEWPSGLDAWAVILISKEVDQFDAAYMEDLRSDAEARGLSSVGLLDSDQHSSLNPGFRVLYQGPYDSLEEADAAALRAKDAGYDFAYPRHVAP